MVEPLNRLRRFLFYGKEENFYQPGDRHTFGYFQKSKLSSIEELISQDQQSLPVTELVRAYNDGNSAHPDSIIFVLAMCAIQECKLTQRNAYLNVPRICKSPESLMLFVKFKEQLKEPQTGWGKGMRKVVQSWYEEEESTRNLATKVTRVQSRYRWSHKDILKLSHIREKEIKNAELNVVIQYIMFGLSKAKAVAEKNPVETTEIIGYLEAITSIKKNENVEDVAAAIRHYRFSPSHISPPMLKKQEIWNALMENMPTRELLELVPILNRLGFLKVNSQKETTPFTNSVVDKLMTDDVTNVHPAHVLVIKKTYENPLLVQKIQQDKKKPPAPAKYQRTLPKPNETVVKGLQSLLDKSLKALKPTGKRFCICLDVRSGMAHGKCWSCPVLTPGDAATIITLCILKSEEESNVKLLAFGDKRMNEITLSTEKSMDDLYQEMKDAEAGPVNLALPFSYAADNNQEFDVFVVITDNAVKGGAQIAQDALQNYRLTMSKPQAKLVVCGLTARNVNIASPTDICMFDIAGFDKHVPKVIEGFARDLF